MEIIKDALAGTLESSDVMVRIGPCDEPEYTELESLGETTIWQRH